MAIFNFIFDLLWTGRGSSVSSVAFLRFLEVKIILRGMAVEEFTNNCVECMHLRSSFRWPVQ